MTNEQKKLLKRYTNDLESVKTMSHYDYVNANSKKISKLLDEFHVIWFHDDPGNMYLVERDSERESPFHV